jgi:glycosyltransferase involved in cell wall biosynthesis
MSDLSDDPLLSALVVAHNEERNLPDCLAGLAFCDELVVVLDRCTDRSKEIAEAAGARILEGAWPVEGDRRNEGIDACRGQWVLEIDADERVTPELAVEIRRTVAESSYDRHNIPVDNYVGRRLVRYGWGAQFGVSSAPRLCRRGVKTWGRDRVHPALRWREGAREGPKLVNRLVHHADENISDLLQRLDRYTTARAADLLDKGDPGGLASNLRRFFSRFGKCYLRRKGYREGGYGFLIAVCAGLYPLISYLKARELQDGKMPSETGEGRS